MKILRFMEYVAAVMIIAGVVLSLGKVAVDQIVAMPARSVSAPLLPPLTEDEKVNIRDHVQYAVQADENMWTAHYIKRSRGGR